MTTPLTFGIQSLGLTWPELKERWPRFDAEGWDTLWVPDHLATPLGGEAMPFLDAWTALAGLAMVTSRARLGVLVSSATFRHPAVLAKQAVTLDHISEGRSILGLGAGWYAWEHEAFGIPFPDTGERVRQFADALAYIDTYLRGEVGNHHGPYFRMTDAPNLPRPVQQPRMPIIVGAHGPRMIGLASRHADIWNSRGTVEEMRERSALVDAGCVAAGRDPADVVRSVSYFPSRSPEAQVWSSPDAFVAWVEKYRAIGFTDFIFDEPFTKDIETATRIAHEILPDLRKE